MPLPPVSTAKTYDLTIYQGARLRLVIQFWANKALGTVADLTGCTASAKVRDNFNPTTSTVIQVLSCTIPTPTNGQAIVSLTKAQTAALQLPSTVPDSQRLGDLGVWDFEMTDGTDDYRYVEGVAKLSREATR